MCQVKIKIPLKIRAMHAVIFFRSPFELRRSVVRGGSDVVSVGVRFDQWF